MITQELRAQQPPSEAAKKGYGGAYALTYDWRLLP